MSLSSLMKREQGPFYIDEYLFYKVSFLYKGTLLTQSFR